MTSDKQRGCCKTISFAAAPFILRIIKCGPQKACKCYLGIFDKKLLRFGNVQITGAYLTGAVKYVPYFLIAISTYDDECTLSSNFYGTPEDKASIESFLSEVKKELL